jgi:hypothetical protein
MWSVNVRMIPYSIYTAFCCAALAVMGCNVQEVVIDSPDQPSNTITDAGDRGEDADVLNSESDGSLSPDTHGGEPTLEYEWRVDEWTSCSEPCGGGLQTRQVWCEDSNGATVDESYCIDTKPSEESSKPEESQACNTHSCDASCPQGRNICNAENESECNLTLEQARQDCLAAGCTPSGPTQCSQGGSPSNPNCWGAVIECSRDPGMISYTWQVGEWSACSEPCGGGTETREISCVNDDGAIVDDALCASTKPQGSRSCNTDACAPMCPPTTNVCNSTSESDCNSALTNARQRCQDAGCTPSSPLMCSQGGSPSNATCWGVVVECH